MPVRLIMAMLMLLGLMRLTIMGVGILVIVHLILGIIRGMIRVVIQVIMRVMVVVIRKIILRAVSPIIKLAKIRVVIVVDYLFQQIVN